MRNPTYEQALEKQGFSWHYEEMILLEDIDLAKGLKNQARLEMPVDEQLIEQYARAMQDGDKFPAVVLWRKTNRHKWQPIDGNQRLAALGKNRENQTDAYVVESADEQVVDRLTWTFNNLVNGKRLSQAEAMEHAASFVRKYGMEVAAAAKEWGIAKSTLAGVLRVREVRDALDRANVKRSPTLTDDKMARLAALSTIGEDVMVKACEVVGKTGASIADVAGMLKDVGRAKTVPEKLKVLQDFAESEGARTRAVETKGGRINPGVLPRDQLAKLLRQALSVMEDHPAKAALRHPAGEKFFCAAAKVSS